METGVTKTSAIAGEVRAELARQNLTAQTLSKSSGIALTTLRRRLTGKSPFTIDELTKVAKALGVSLTSLVNAAAERAA